MEKSEVFQMLGGLVVLVVFFFLNKMGMFLPGAARTMLEAAAIWWQTNALWVYVGLGLFNICVFGFLCLRVMRTKMKQAAINARVTKGPTFFLLPRSDWKPVDPSKVDLWARLAEALPHDEHISFEMGGSDTDLFFALHGSEDGLRAALTQFKAEWPGLQRRLAEPDPALLPEGWQLHWIELCPRDWKQPILALSNDPLRSLLVEVNGVIGRGRGLVQVIARNDFGTRAKLGRAAFGARAGQVQNAGVKALHVKEARTLEERAGQAFLQVTVRCVGLADSKPRAEGIARGLARAVSASYGHRNPVRPVKNGKDPLPVIERLMGRTQVWANDELATLAHLTGSDMLFVAPRLKTASAKSLPPDPEMRVTPADLTARFSEESV
jgi:hypothetical protein